MFTGLVLAVGRVTSVERTGGDIRFGFACPCPLPGLVVGESIAVNGACLTVESGQNHPHSVFSAFASAETLLCTTLGSLKAGAAVNLERALALGDRLGGHVVSGHVDAVATVVSLSPAGQSRRVRVRFPEAFAPEVLPKGSVTLDGVSLTVNRCEANILEVNVIPETWRATTLAHWQAGHAVNLETDVLGKYVRHNLLLAGLVPAPEGHAASRLSEEFLRENGFL